MPLHANATITVITSESFTNASTTPNGFIYGYGQSSATTNPCLTAGSSSTPATSIPGCAAAAIDSVGSGALRLTNNQGNQAGFIINTMPHAAINGLQIEFDYFSWGGSAAGGGGGNADGLSFFFIDGSQSPTQAGGFGGSLGYAVHTPAAGLVGGFADVGFDEFGNYSNPTEGRVGGPGPEAPTVAIRGSASSNYAYVTGYQYNGSTAGTLPFQLSSPNATSRPTQPIHIRLTLSAASIFTVDIDNITPTCPCNAYVRYIQPTNLNSIAGQASFPTTFKYGFAASTGGSTNYHEVRNFSATTAPPDITITKTHAAAFPQNGTSAWTIGTQVTSLGGPAPDPITVTDTLPTGFTLNGSATGTSWSCSSTGTPPTVTCTYTPTGPGVAPGTQLPNITIPVNVPNQSNTQYINTATVSTTQIAKLSPTTAQDTVSTNTAVPLIQLFKRIVQIVRTYHNINYTAGTIVPTPDPTAAALATMKGTANYQPGFLPGDVVTYAIYFRNIGGLAASATAFSDVIPGQFNIASLVNSGTTNGGTNNLGFTCCSNPTVSIAGNYSLTNTDTINYAMATPLPIATPSGTAAPIQGYFSYSVSLP